MLETKKKVWSIEQTAFVSAVLAELFLPILATWLRDTSAIQLYIHVAPSIYLFCPLQTYHGNIKGKEDMRKKTEREIQNCKELITWGVERTITFASKIHQKQFPPLSVRCTTDFEGLILLGSARCQQANLQVSYSDPYTWHTACERRLKWSDMHIVRSIVRSLGVATVHEVEAKLSYFHLPQPRYYLLPNWFSSWKPPWKIVVFMRQGPGESQLQFRVNAAYI